MDKLIVTTNEVESVQVVAAEPAQKAESQAAIPLWARLVILPLVVVLPGLCVVAGILRVALRASIPRTRQAWGSYLNWLLIASGLLSSVAAVLLFFTFPMPPQPVSAGLPDFDARATFPGLPAGHSMDGEQIAETMRPLVVIASPVARTWFSKSDLPSGEFGAALLLAASPSGYLFATARHIVDAVGIRKNTHRVLLNTGDTGWSMADVVGRNRDFDVALLWVRRHSGEGSFVQPLAASSEVKPGEAVFVIGHPEGLNFSISNGIVSRTSEGMIQISAPVSPGNSGGPVYNDRGELLGVVSFKMDHRYDPNAENLNFAVSAGTFATMAGWDFRQNGKQEFENYRKELQKSSAAGPIQETHGHN